MEATQWQGCTWGIPESEYRVTTKLCKSALWYLPHSAEAFERMLESEHAIDHRIAAHLICAGHE